MQFPFSKVKTSFYLSNTNRNQLMDPVIKSKTGKDPQVSMNSTTPALYPQYSATSYARKGATYPFCSLNLELQILPMTISSVVFPVADSVPRYDEELLRVSPVNKQHLCEAIYVSIKHRYARRQNVQQDLQLVAGLLF